MDDPDSHRQPSYTHGLHCLPTSEQSQAPHHYLQDTFSLTNHNTFDPSAQFEHAPFALQPYPLESFLEHTISNNCVNKPPGETDEQIAVEQVEGQSNRGKKGGLFQPSGRRKEQNRAAQRAFRERKERNVKDLEEKVVRLENDSDNLRSEYECLKHELEKFKTENNILRASSDSLQQQRSTPDNRTHDNRSSAPTDFTPNDFFAKVMPDGYPSQLHRVMVCQSTGEKLLDASATWDVIKTHELFKRGLVDIIAICERLRRKVQCSGQGPVFAEGHVKWAIEESAAWGSDKLA